MTVLVDTIKPFPGYRIVEQIYLGSRTIVYRGIREQDHKPVIIKMMRNEYPSFNEIAQFRNQYSITKNLNLSGIIKTYSLENYRNGYAIVMEDFGGVSLKQWIGKNIETLPINLQTFLDISIQITSILDGLHRHRIIHKDIKPANILIHPNTKEIRIIDFSIASVLPRELQSLTNPNILEGTLTYISPEQTGRMNRGIDYRADFYSLGVTFFELLTGQLPFTNTDQMELVYCHIAKEPPRLSYINPKIPSILSDIISKLMAKNAEDRYQSALGLKYDLEVCKQQWQQTEKIDSFELATRDISDRFLIPEKLYGRHQEVETLLAAFERATGGATEMILVAGDPGVGKTAVVNEVHKPIVRQRSYFIRGKFDQFQRDIPFSAWIEAFRDLIRQILSESDAQIQQWQEQILLALGDQAQVITNVIPQLEQIIGEQPEVAELSGSAAENRFNLLFQRFIKVFSSQGHPLVIFLDDLQWADAASLKFIQLLVNSNSKELERWEPELIGETQDSLLLIGAYRDNEVSKTHPLYLALNQSEKDGAIINTITLKNLNQSDLNRLIADTLHCTETLAVPLTQMVFAKTKGNPFFSTRFLKSLHTDGLIKFYFDLGYWQYSLTEIKTLSLTDDVVEFMALQIEKLPKPTQEILKLAACIGNQFDLKSLSIVYEKNITDTASDLWIALHEGLILPQTENYKLFAENGDSLLTSDDVEVSIAVPKYKFVHDRVQQAAYTLIPENKKQIFHLKIGELLLTKTPVTEWENNIFALVNQFNMAVKLIVIQAKRDELAEMNLIAGHKALASTAYTAALKYLSTGIELLADDSWERKYELTLALYETAAEAAYLAGEFEYTKKFIQKVLGQAKTLLEKVKVYQVQIEAYKAQGQGIEAIDIGLQVLSFLGIDFPNQPTKDDVEIALQETQLALVDKQIEQLIDLPEMVESTTLAIMNILGRLLPIAYTIKPLLFSLFVFKQVSLSLKYGNCSTSALSYSTYGITLWNLSDINSSYKFGQLALQLLKKEDAKAIKCIVTFVVNAFIRVWQEHIKATLKHLLEAYAVGIEIGDIEQSAYSLYMYSEHSFWQGKELVTLEQEINTYHQKIAQLNQTTPLHLNAINRETILNLLGESQINDSLLEQIDNEENMLILRNEVDNKTVIFYRHLQKLFLCYLFQDYLEAKKQAMLIEEYLDAVPARFVVAIFYFYSSLALLAVYHEANQSEQEQILGKVLDYQNQFKKLAEQAPMNFLHKYYLLEAEQHRVLGNNLEAINCYDRAICLAKENEYIHEEALANELAAKFYLECGRQKIAQVYLIDAYYGYVRWGAKAKVDNLAKCYPQLLAHILQHETLNYYPSEQSRVGDTASVSTLNDRQTVIGSQTSISDSLDLAAVIKVSQALSGEIELEQLLSTLMRAVMENAGASKCALILNTGNNLNLTVTAISSSSAFAPIHTEFPSLRLELSQDILPITLVNYVKRTGEIVVVDDTKAEEFLANDYYVLRQQPKSLLCIPISNQGKFLGILYLENNLTTAAFTRDRVELLKLIVTQGAISLENAILYRDLIQAKKSLEEYSHTLEEKVEQRTQELNNNNQRLQQAILDLQNAQSQLIQNEKMSSLGQMVAGIAHEINNPINFIHGNIAHAREYVQDLLDLITVYQQEYPHPSGAVTQKSEEIDLEFLLQDLPKLIDSMKIGTSRIRNIVLGLRNFSRLDEADMKPVDVHEGIDNSLMILQHKLKAKSDRPEIGVIKEYGQLPPVNCYAGQLNQVFMNILSNAIDALEEGIVRAGGDTGIWGQGNKETWCTEKTQFPLPQIRIHTELADRNIVRIRIMDNGCGMPIEVQQKIFDPFFTTKPVGSGTGLGLSISYQIVVDKHKGQLICNSSIGNGTEFMIEIPIQG
ncbi:serine/threonine protein kinase [Chlorogloeopsis fritschii PCC 6912]|uniref:histidine kinase n=1 Tax=Chlorogloeopsis fritschii PCC 6912 TaxID=211165 RepID=A0A433N8Z9_CHLFR|nr:ATP-binding sensor histidine kinase [Chlorogloeopsis fritschii]RUR78227.1 serine/threonine protein kinase [Chlorogloeopsis fritschii PCC 6912]